MAWVPLDQAADGTPIWIRVQGRPALAQVVKLPFYDPEGARMKA
jgi:glycine cleavage system aminomethyltransferase T